MRKSRFFPVVVLLLSLASCGTAKSPQQGNTVQASAPGQQAGLVEKYWKLTELGGSALVSSDKWRREPHMILKADGNKLNGHGGCNSFFGTYELPGGNGIRFTGVGSTRMACEDMQVEYRFLQALQAAGQYTVQGDALALQDAKGTVLARFAAVYLR
ncbi:META domain-containing protein [Paraflavisolibacter sp. H34]|uniref:META domain-containing protein n=1 Tax=Huijunlia imazamoxiresistens TaxID=3127457 RepID=UPI0030173033